MKNTLEKKNTCYITKKKKKRYSCLTYGIYLCNIKENPWHRKKEKKSIDLPSLVDVAIHEIYKHFVIIFQKDKFNLKASSATSLTSSL